MLVDDEQDVALTSKDKKKWNLENIITALDECTKASKNVWLVLVTFSVYCGITCWNIEDSSFYSISANTSLPIIGANVPTFSFTLIFPVIFLILQIKQLVNVEKIANLAFIYKTAYKDSEEILIPSQPWVGTDWIILKEVGWSFTTKQHFLAKIIFFTSVFFFPFFIIAYMFEKTLIIQNVYLSLYLLMMMIFMGTVCIKIFYPREKFFSKNSISNSKYWLILFSTFPFIIFGIYISFYHNFIDPREPVKRIDLSLQADMYAQDLSVMPTDWEKFKSTHPEGLNTSVSEIGRFLNKIRSPNLSNKTISFADMRLTYLANTNFWGCKAIATNFTGATLDGSNFVGCDLTAAIFDKASLNSVDFSATNLKGVTFVGADLRFAKIPQLDLTYGDSTTILPEGMKPPAQWVQFDDPITRDRFLRQTFNLEPAKVNYSN